MTTLFAFCITWRRARSFRRSPSNSCSCARELTLAVARRLPIVDAVLGVSAGILLVVGLLRVFYFREKRRLLFPKSRLPHKLSVFIAVALSSIIPTVEFLSWRKDVRKGQEPAVTEQKLRFLRKVIHGESPVDRTLASAKYT